MLAVISYPPIPIFEVGPLTMSLHGLFAAFGVLAGTFYVSKVLGRRGYDVVKFQSVMTWAIVGSLFGARWLTIPAYWAEFGFDIAQLWNVGGNYSIMGGFAGGILAATWRMRMVGLEVWPTLDSATFGLAIGTIVGRIGDLAIVEHLGAPTNFFLGFGVKPGYDLAPQHNALECDTSPLEYCLVPEPSPLAGAPGIYHPTGLYDLLGAMVLFAVLYWVVHTSGWRLRYGQLFMGWVVWYGLQRFLIDFTRLALEVGDDPELGPLTWSQWSGLVAALVAAGVFIWFGRRHQEVTPENDVVLAGASDADAGEADSPEI